MRLRLSVSNSAPTAAASAEVLFGRTAVEVTPAFTMLEGPVPGRVFRMGAESKRAYVAGRASEADFAIPDATVSRQHARFWIECGSGEDRALVEDLGSTNGTFVNGERVCREQLSRGDRVVLGSVVLRYDLLDPVEVRVAEELEARVRSADLDALTGLETRRALEDLDAPAVAPGGGPLSAILVDLDHFKSVNDTFGHPAGDQVLKLAAAALQSSLRSGDLAIRWGGEEFLAVLPAAELPAACVVAKRILECVREQEVQAITPGRGLSASLGVAAARPGENLRQLVERADRALYRAKNAGRGRVEADPDVDPAR
jgi:diguanylate cyclase (GGDEF)-like protein